MGRKREDRGQRTEDSGTYRPGPYRFFHVHDPKKRRIAVASFRDRVVHHAVVRVLTPIYERCFIFHSYATRPGKGTHAAITQAQKDVRQSQWFVKADIQKFFDSVLHETLFSLLCRKLKDKNLLTLMEKIIRNTDTPGFGLPIGNLTSQFLANVYLDPLDHWLKDQCRVRRYIRYMDDFVIFADTRAEVQDLLQMARNFLQESLGLQLKPGGFWLNRSTHGLSFLGHCIYPGLIRVRRVNLRRSLKRINGKQSAWAKGYVDEDHLARSLWSSIGHLRVFNLHLPVA